MPAPLAYEYRVVPAPKRGIKTKTAKTTEDRFAAALEASLNEQGSDGWEFVRSDTLPSEERQGLTGRTTVYHTVLIYRRAVGQDAEVDLSPRKMIAAPVIAAPVIAAAGPATLPLATPVAHAVAHPVAHPVAPSVGPDAADIADAPRPEQTIIAPRPIVPGVHGHDAPQSVPPLGGAGPRLAGK